MKKVFCTFTVLLLLLSFVPLSDAQRRRPPRKKPDAAATPQAPSKNLGTFVNHSYQVGDKTHTAALYLPKDYDKTKKYPLVIYLHGGGGNGDNEGDAISGWERRHPPSQALFANPEKYPALILIPRCPKGKLWAPTPKNPEQSPWREKRHGKDPIPDAAEQLTTAIDEVIKKYSVDEERISIAGYSMGGEGSILYAALNADRFAALASMAGSAVIVPEDAPKLAKMKVWMFQGEKDGVSPTDLAKKMAAAIKKAGGDVKLTIYPGVGHGFAGTAFGEDDVLGWLIKQKKTKK